MPTYQYACTACDEQLEAVQAFTDAPLTECPACGGRLRKVYSAVGVVFKGSGFYKTDSRKATSESGSSSGSSSSSSKDSSSSSSSKESSSGGSTKDGTKGSGGSGSSAGSAGGSSSGTGSPAAAAS